MDRASGPGTPPSPGIRPIAGVLPAKPSTDLSSVTTANTIVTQPRNSAPTQPAPAVARRSITERPRLARLRWRPSDSSPYGSFIADTLYQNGFRLKLLKEEEIDLEDVFIRITKGITN